MIGKWYQNPMFPKRAKHFIPKPELNKEYSSLCGQIDGEIFPIYKYINYYDDLHRELIECELIEDSSGRLCKSCLRLYEKRS